MSAADPQLGLAQVAMRSPERTAAEAARAEPAKAAGGGGNPALKVLLVEDNPGDSMLIRFALSEVKGHRFVITPCITLAEAIAQIGGAPIGGGFDVALLDLNLPDSDGLVTLTRLQDAAPDLPLVILTGVADTSLAAQALEGGAQDFLVKGDDSGWAVARAIRYAITRMNSLKERHALLARMTEEITAARAMQFDLLPNDCRIRQALVAQGFMVESLFEPSSGIGGDLWGCAPIGLTKMGFFTFDFAGHGISAALNVFRLHTLIRNEVDWFADPAEMLHRINEHLAPLLAPGQYATIFLCCIDTVADTLVWSAAGAPAPILVDGDHMETLDTRGLPLGLHTGTRYTNRHVSFPPGTSLFLYSDGFSEARDRDGEMIGEFRMMGLAGQVAAEGGGSRLERLLDFFLDTTRPPLEDDLTALWITRPLAPETI